MRKVPVMIRVPYPVIFVLAPGVRALVKTVIWGLAAVPKTVFALKLLLALMVLFALGIRFGTAVEISVRTCSRRGTSIVGFGVFMMGRLTVPPLVWTGTSGLPVKTLGLSFFWLIASASPARTVE